MPEVRIIVVAYDAGSLLRPCLASLADQTWRDFEVVVVDNGPAGDPAGPSMPADPRFTLMSPGRNLGFAAGCNLGAAGATAPWLALLNPDAIAEPGWLAALMSAAGRFPQATMFGSTQLDAADPGRLDGCGDVYSAAGVAWRGDWGRPAPLELATGTVFSPCAAAALYRRDRFEAAGGFEERFFCYYEDVDLAFRLRLLGDACIQVADAVVRHHGSGIAGRSSAFTVYHSFRNRLWTFCSVTPGALLAVLLPLHAAATVALLAKAARHGRFVPAARGLADGLAGLPALRRARRPLRRARRVPLMALARMFTWSPRAILTRAADVRPPPPPPPPPGAGS